MAVLQGLSQMGRADTLLVGQIGDRASDFERVMVASGGETELAGRRFHQALARTIESAVDAEVGKTHGRVD